MSTRESLQPFLASTAVVDAEHPSIRSLAQDLAAVDGDPVATARRCFEWVRDEVRHTGDHGGPITRTASEVLEHRTGFCYAKSHLLAALLRSNGIPTGFGYQRLSADDTGPPFCLHGFNAVLLPVHGWYRLDARGNNARVRTWFNPPTEHLAYTPGLPGEVTYPEIWPAPLPVVLQALLIHPSREELLLHLPDWQP